MLHIQQYDVRQEFRDRDLCYERLEYYMSFGKNYRNPVITGKSDVVTERTRKQRDLAHKSEATGGEPVAGKLARRVRRGGR